MHISSPDRDWARPCEAFIGVELKWKQKQKKRKSMARSREDRKRDRGSVLSRIVCFFHTLDKKSAECLKAI